MRFPAYPVLRLAAATLALALAACAPERREAVEVRVPEGANVERIAETLADQRLLDHPFLFRAYVKLRGTEGQLKAGRYRFARGASWDEILDALERGAVVTVPLTIPEGYTGREIAPRLARVAAASPDSVLSMLRDTSLARELGVPGPTLEGYLFPDTYHFSEGVHPRAALEAMVQRYREFWGAGERRRADSLGLTEREVVTLASIVEAEARVAEERPIIAGVYLNRLARGMLLQADPTVQYALGEPKPRLLYRDIDAVAGDPYNTYTHPGLPPGPIGAPGAASLRAVLEPAEVPYLFFVARPDGSHVFTETEREHINAKNRIRARAAARGLSGERGGAEPGEGRTEPGEGGSEPEEGGTEPDTSRSGGGR